MRSRRCRRRAPRRGGGRHSAKGTAGAGRKPRAGGAASTALYENLTTWTFGELPELLEIRRGGQTLFGFPALVDRGTHCDVEVFDSPDEAARNHRAGLRRLFALQLQEPIKYLEKNMPGLREMAMQYMPLGTQEELRDQIDRARRSIAPACRTRCPTMTPVSKAHATRASGRLTLLAQEIARLVGQILGEYASVTEEARAGEVVRGRPCRHAGAAQRADRQALHGRHTVHANWRISRAI